MSLELKQRGGDNKQLQMMSSHWWCTLNKKKSSWWKNSHFKHDDLEAFFQLGHKMTQHLFCVEKSRCSFAAKNLVIFLRSQIQPSWLNGTVWPMMLLTVWLMRARNVFCHTVRLIPINQGHRPKINLMRRSSAFLELRGSLKVHSQA